MASLNAEATLTMLISAWQLNYRMPRSIRARAARVTAFQDQAAESGSVC